MGGPTSSHDATPEHRSSPFITEPEFVPQVLGPHRRRPHAMLASGGKRPRNVDWKAAAAILYGHWGTSKAYVIGLAFAVAGYASFWLIAAMCILTALVGVNYMTIC